MLLMMVAPVHAQTLAWGAEKYFRYDIENVVVTPTAGVAGSYSVKELVPLGWVLTGIGGGLPVDQNDPNNTKYYCTVAGTGGSVGIGDLSTQNADVTLKNGIFHTLAAKPAGFFKIFPDEPRSCRPSEASIGKLLPHCSGKGQGPGYEVGEIAVQDFLAKLGKSDVEMRLENNVDLRYPVLFNGAGILRRINAPRLSSPSSGDPFL